MNINTKIDFSSKKVRLSIAILIIIPILLFVSLTIFKYANGIVAVEKHISSMMDIMSPSMEDIETFEEMYTKLSPFEKKFVANYDDYLMVHDTYIDSLIDSFAGGEDYNMVNDILGRHLGKHVNFPDFEIDKEQRLIKINMLTGPETENQLVNNDENVVSYLDIMAEDAINVTREIFDISSMYGLDVIFTASTMETDGMDVIKAKNGTLEYYILEQQ